MARSRNERIQQSRARPLFPGTQTKRAPSRKAGGSGPSGESRTHGLLNPILCDEWYGRTHRKKSAETSHFQAFLFPRFWYGTGSFITHSLRPRMEKYCRLVLVQTRGPQLVRAKERCGLENGRLDPSPHPKTDVPP